MFVLVKSPQITLNILKFNHCRFIRSTAAMATNSSKDLLDRALAAVPELTNALHKGQSGRIGVIGGSFEYTGAPYFSAISALRVGADLAHIFCMKDAATAIKSYSPELIVHPCLDSDDAATIIEPWLHRLHVIVIGPGMGRDIKILSTVRNIIQCCRKLNKPLVIDADGLFLLSEDLSIIHGYPGVILTPNIVEFERIFGKDGTNFEEKIHQIGLGNVTVLEKGFTDRIYSTDKLDDCLQVSGGSNRRCGGQGDILSGTVATFYAWTIMNGDPEPAKVACFASSYFFKECSQRTFKQKGRSMITGDIISTIHQVFTDLFEKKS